jgi:hypothetical protein
VSEDLELVVLGQGGDIGQLLDADDGDLAEGRDPSGGSVGGVLNLRVRDDPVHVPVPSRSPGGPDARR